MKKGLNIILIIIVIGIYAKVFWPSNNNKIIQQNDIIHRNHVSQVSSETNFPTELNLNFRDPFLHTKVKELKKVVKPKTNLSHTKPRIKSNTTVIKPATPNVIYKGRIFNPSNQVSKGLISFNNKELIVQINDSISDFKVIEINKTELVIKSKNHHATIKKN